MVQMVIMSRLWQHKYILNVFLSWWWGGGVVWNIFILNTGNKWFHADHIGFHTSSFNLCWIRMYNPLRARLLRHRSCKQQPSPLRDLTNRDISELYARVTSPLVSVGMTEQNLLNSNLTEIFNRSRSSSGKLRLAHDHVTWVWHWHFPSVVLAESLTSIYMLWRVSWWLCRPCLSVTPIILSSYHFYLQVSFRPASRTLRDERVNVLCSLHTNSSLPFTVI